MRRLRVRRLTRFRAGIASVGAATLTALMAFGATLPAQAAHKSVPRRACGVTALVRLHGTTFLIHRYGRFGVLAMRGRHLAPDEPITPHCAKVDRAGAAQVNGVAYGAGPLETHPVVYLDFWGSQWGADGNGVVQYLEDLFDGLGAAADTWSTTTSQYTDNGGDGPSLHGPVLAGVWMDNSAPAPASASADDVAAEAQDAARFFGVAGPDVDIFVLSPSGTTPAGFNTRGTGFCAYHDWDGTTAYTNMPYVLDAGGSCGEDSVQGALDGFSIVAGHEYAEAITDPVPPTGYTAPNGSEVGDLCAWQELGAVSLATGTFAMQSLWSDRDGGCVMRPGTGTNSGTGGAGNS